MIKIRDVFRWGKTNYLVRIFDYDRLTYHCKICRRGRQVRCRNEKWLSWKDHSRLPLIRLNAIYLHSNINEYTFLSLSLSFSFLLSLSLFSFLSSPLSTFFQGMYLCAAPPLTLCTERKREERRPILFPVSSLLCFFYREYTHRFSPFNIGAFIIPRVFFSLVIRNDRETSLPMKTSKRHSSSSSSSFSSLLDRKEKKDANVDFSAYPLLLINKETEEEEEEEENKIVCVSTKSGVCLTVKASERDRGWAVSIKGDTNLISKPIRFSFFFELSGMLIQIISRRKRDYQLSLHIERLDSKRIIKSTRTSILNKTSSSIRCWQKLEWSFRIRRYVQTKT